MEFDFDGLLNACEGLIKRTRDDYIKGANRMMRIYGQVITEKEAIQNHEKYRKLTQGIGRNIIKHYTDARTFVERDPYCYFLKLRQKRYLIPGIDWLRKSVRTKMIRNFYTF